MATKTAITADTLVRTGPTKLFGWTFAEDDGTPAAATVKIYDGVNTSGTLLAQIELAASSSNTEWFGPQGIYCQTGIYVDEAAGSVAGSIFWG